MLWQEIGHSVGDVVAVLLRAFQPFVFGWAAKASSIRASGPGLFASVVGELTTPVRVAHCELEGALAVGKRELRERQGYRGVLLAGRGGERYRELLMIERRRLGLGLGVH